jgi:hypothetical protein
MERNEVNTLFSPESGAIPSNESQSGGMPPLETPLERRDMGVVKVLT